MHIGKNTVRETWFYPQSEGLRRSPSVWGFIFDPKNKKIYIGLFECYITFYVDHYAKIIRVNYFFNSDIYE